MKTQEIALEYIAKGLSVVAIYQTIGHGCTCSKGEKCLHPGKHPVPMHGLKDATNSPEKLHLAGFKGETQNIAIRTGNGLLVLDFDEKSGGLNTLAELISQYGDFPLTPKVKTGGGGYHFYFALPPGQEVGSKQGFLPGVDTRSSGGYAIAPPSLHQTGNRYVWEVDLETPIAPCPEWLLTLLPKKEPKKSSKAPNNLHLLTAIVEDLASHPGANEGTRNATLCRLVGIHLAQGDDPTQVLTLAIEWGSRCQPPMDNNEISQTVISLIKKETENQLGELEASEDFSRKPKVTIPVLHPDGLYGPAGELVKLIEPETETDPVAILVTFLVMAGNYVGRRCFFRVEASKHFPNIFAVMVGDSARARKGTSLDRVLGLWDPQDPWIQNHVSGLSSGEGLINAVRDDVSELYEDLNNPGTYLPRVMKHGVEDKRLFVVESEFAQPLRVAKREGNTLSVVIRNAFDGKALRILNKTDPTTATDSHISILGHVTRDELIRELNGADISNGFGNRFLWVFVERKKLLPDGGTPVDLVPLRNIVIANLMKVEGELKRDAKAKALWHEIYKEMGQKRPGVWGSITSRGEALTLRLSLIYSILDGSNLIEETHLKAAYAVWRYADASARLIFGSQNSLSPLEVKILKAIELKPGINRRGIHQEIGGNTKANLLNAALDSLVKKALIYAKMEGSGGRPAECWYPFQ